MLKVFMEKDKDFTFSLKTKSEELEFIKNFHLKGLKKLKVKERIILGEEINNIQYIPDFEFKEGKSNLRDGVFKSLFKNI